jgi:hypothetical protein
MPLSPITRGHAQLTAAMQLAYADWKTWPSSIGMCRAAGVLRAGWPWRLPARAPTDPDVHTLAHPVPRPTGSPSTMVPEAIRPSYGNMLIEPRCVRHVSLDWVCRPTLRFPPQGPPRRVPLLQRYYQSATTSCRPSRRTSFPSLGGTSVPLVAFAPRRTSAPPRPGVGHPVAPAGMLPRKRQDLPSSWGTPIVRLHMFSRRRQDCLHQTIAE